MKNRIEWIDVLKYICITIVIIVHWEGCSDTVKNFVEPFFLTSFYFASGYCYKQKENFKSLLYKKIRTLLVPWLFFSTINILLSHIYSFKEHELLLTEIKMNLLQVRGCGDQQWFLASLFIAFIPFYFIVKFDNNNKKKEKVIIIYLLIGSIIQYCAKYYMKINNLTFAWGNTNLPWHFETLFNSLLFMYFGYYFRNRIEKTINEYFSKKNIFVLLIIYGILCYYISSNIILINSIINIITEIVGVLLVINISKVYKSNRFNLFCGQHTLTIFCIQRKIETILQFIFSIFMPSLYGLAINNFLFSICFSLLFALLNLLILIVAIKVVESLFPFIFGKQKSMINN